MTAKILIVDDAAFSRTLLEGILSPEGYEIIQACSGREAIAKYEEFRPDLVIMDIVMPGLQGTQAAKSILSADPGAKIIMCTATGQESIVNEAIKDGVRAYIVKPLKADDVLEVVKSVLAG